MSDKKQIEVTIKPFDRTLVKNTSFRCGQPDLDEWLRRYAGQQERSHNTRTFLAVPAGSSQIVGYYATTGYRLDQMKRLSALGLHGTPIRCLPCCWRDWPSTSTGLAAASGSNC